MIERNIDKFIMDGVQLNVVDSVAREELPKKASKVEDIDPINSHLGEIDSDIIDLTTNLNALDSKVNGLIKIGEVTATTSQYGLIGSGKNYASCYILGAWVETGGYLLEPYVSGGNWGIRIMSRTTLDPIANTEITAKFIYIDR